MLQSSFISSLHYLLLAFILLIQTKAELEQCQEDCHQSPPFRLIGPTRPWHEKDLLGNELGLTKSHPFAMAGSYLGLVRFNISYECIYEHSSDDATTIVNDDSIFAEGEILLENVTAALNKMLNNTSFDLEVLSLSVDNNENGENATSITTLEMNMQVDIVVESGLESSHASLVHRIEGGLKEMTTNHDGHLDLVVERSIQISSFEKTRILHAGQQNPYSMFCELGCAYLYSSPSDPLHISDCTHRCDEYYKYNVTVGYNDLIEVARLECRDGCQIGLMR